MFTPAKIRCAVNGVFCEPSSNEIFLQFPKLIASIFQVSRVTQSLSLLDLLEELESIFSEPLFICDVKPEHFGISDHGRVKLLDTDSAHFESIAGIEWVFFTFPSLQQHEANTKLECLPEKK